MGNSFSHPHTVLLHYSNLDVKNLFEEPITTDQFESRAIIKGFTVAASRAKTIYGVCLFIYLLTINMILIVIINYAG